VYRIADTMTNLNARAWISLAVLALVMGLLVFVPAGTIHYWQAWVYLSIFFGASALSASARLSCGAREVPGHVHQVEVVRTDAPKKNREVDHALPVR